MLTLVEELSLRTRRVQAMMRQMEDIVAPDGRDPRQLPTVRCNVRTGPRNERPSRAANSAT